jgi:hypothetical protein
MRNARSPIKSSGKRACRIALPGAGFMLVCSVLGCSAGNSGTPPGSGATATGPQNYFAPIIAGTTYSVTGSTQSPSLLTPLSYTIDDTGLGFSDTTFQPETQPGPQVLNDGTVSPGQRGLMSLEITTNYAYDSSIPEYVPIVISYPTPPPPTTGSFALELANQAGGLVQLTGQPVAPLAPATDCPSSASPQTYLFLTIPKGLGPAGNVVSGFDPTTDTGYGVVEISSSGSAVTLQSIQQFTLGGAAPAQPGPSSMTGICATSFFGNTTVVPGQVVIGMPKPGSGSIPPQATIAIGPGSGGLLVEDNGSNATSPLPNTTPPLGYNNVLGAGTGAVGLPQPTSPVSTSDVVGAQYLGFIYGAGVFTNADDPPAGWTSHLASFGFSTVPLSCPSVDASDGTLIYGGDFPQYDGEDNPSASPNSDLAIDLGPQSSTTNGLYPSATVCVGGGYVANDASGETYSFPAVAIAGQLNGKYAIFVLGVDSTQPWAIYLLQSN